jgi:SpoVK/Ycf46/Vps4 family AAA+-type ATPase
VEFESIGGLESIKQALYELEILHLRKPARFCWMLYVDTRRRATAPAFFVCLTKRVFSQLGETKILLESPSSNLRELEIPN